MTALLLGCVSQSGRAETLPVRPYTVNEGLAHNHVSRIYRDSHDFLWICTDEGLSRFDGHRFVNYTVASGLPHMHVNDIIEARTGEYWIATDGGLVLFRPADPRPIAGAYRPDGPPQALFTNAVAEEPDGAVLFGTAAGLYRLRRHGGQPRIERIDFPSPPDVYETAFVNAIHQDGDGGLWLGAATGLYWRNPAGAWARFTRQHGLPHDFVDRIASDGEGRLWICTRHGLARISRNPRAGQAVVDLTLAAADGLPHDDVRAVAFTSDGRRWLGTIGGLVEWRPEETGAARFRIYTERNGLTDRAVYAIAEDPEGNLWLGSRRGGVMRLNPAGFRTFGASDGLVFSGDDRIVQTRSGLICVAAAGDPRRAIRCYDGRRFRATFPRLPPDILSLSPGSRQSTIQDHLGAWWISSGRGLLRFGAGRLAGSPNLRLLPHVGARHLYEDSRGDLWIATHSPRGFGLVRWERTAGALQDYADQLPVVVRERNIDAISEAPPGQLWIGLARPGGIFHLRGGRFQELHGAPPGGINALYPDHSGRLWVATMEGGLGRIDQPGSERPSIRFYTRSHGLSSNEIWSLAEDRAGHIYAGTARGVDRLDPATGRIIRYSHADGLAPGDIRAALSDRSGDLWFLSNRGLSQLHPVHWPQRKAPVVRIAGIRVAGTPHRISELGEADVGPIEFPSGRNSFHIDFSAIDYRSLEQLRYQFRLEGAGGEWSEPAPDATVHLASLAPGRYRFLVRAVSSEGLGSPAPASFSFSISPPFWKRWWFQVAAVTALGIAVFAAHRFRLAQAVALERLRTRIAIDLHDDIGSSLTQISLLTEAARHEIGSGSAAAERLSRVAGISRELVRSMGDIVWAVNPGKDRLGDLTVRMRHFAADLLASRDIEFLLRGPEAERNLPVEPEFRRQVYLFFKECVHNIARHAECTSVEVDLAIKQDQLLLRLVDDGKGFDASPPGGGYGFESLRRRAEELGGEVQVLSRMGSGTTVTLRAPLVSRRKAT